MNNKIITIENFNCEEGNVVSIELGKEYKYKDLCKLINQEPKSGCSKNFQLREWKELFKYRRIGKTKYIVDKIYKYGRMKSTEEAKYSARSKGGIKGGEIRIEKIKLYNNDNYKVSKKDENCVGVYCFKHDSLIYIGSTTQSFRKRYLEHLNQFSNNRNNTGAKEILKHKDFTFEILIKYEKDTSDNKVSKELEREIRDRESELIKEYKYNKDKYICINSKDDTFYYYKKVNPNRDKIEDNNKLIKEYREKIKKLKQENKKLSII